MKFPCGAGQAALCVYVSNVQEEKIWVISDDFDLGIAAESLLQGD